MPPAAASACPTPATPPGLQLGQHPRRQLVRRPPQLDRRPLLQLAHPPRAQPPRPPSQFEREHAARVATRRCCRPARRRPNVCASSHLLHAPPSSHRLLQWQSASCACTSAMHSRNEAPASRDRSQTAYPRNDAVLGVAPVIRQLALSPLAVAPPR